MKSISAILLLLFVGTLASAQTDDNKNNSEIIQFSGIVVTEDAYGEMTPLPYTTIAVKGTSRGTSAEIDGFFSIAALRGDTLVFSRLGYQTIEHTVPDTLASDFYSWYQIMSEGDVLLPEAVIYPWPSREHYKIEFLALDVSNELRQRARDNLTAEILERMQHGVAADGENAFELESAKRQYEYQYTGQFKPQKIFDVVAWSKFIKAWKRGDFKRKKKKKDDK